MPKIYLVGPGPALKHLGATQVWLGEDVAEGLAPGEHAKVDAAAEVDQLEGRAQPRELILGGAGEDARGRPKRHGRASVLHGAANWSW